MVSFKKNGRPTKIEKGLLKNINNFLSSLSDNQKKQYDFSDETITDGERLSEVWNFLQGNYPTNTVKKESVSKPNPLPEFNEIKIENTENTKEGVNFANNKEAMAEKNDIHGIETMEEEIPSFFNPLSEPIKERSYNKASQADVGHIDEPRFDNNPSVEEQLDELKDKEEEYRREQDSKKEETKERVIDRITNDDMEELDEKDKKIAASQLVQTVLDSYETLHEIGKKIVQYSDEKIQEKVLNNEIDPTMEIPVDDRGTTTNPIEFFQGFNQQAAEAISYDPAFGDKVRPTMERVFAKKGWGMTDEQFLIVTFGKDIAWKGFQIISLKKTASQYMSAFERMHKEKLAAIRESNANVTYAKPDSITTPPPQPFNPPPPNYNPSQPTQSNGIMVVQDTEFTENNE